MSHHQKSRQDLEKKHFEERRKLYKAKEIVKYEECVKNFREESEAELNTLMQKIYEVIGSNKLQFELSQNAYS